jgi:hypothetical protein
MPPRSPIYGREGLFDGMDCGRRGKPAAFVIGDVWQVIATGHPAGGPDSASDHPQAQKRGHGLKVPVVVQKAMTARDTKCADDQVDRFAHGDPTLS